MQKLALAVENDAGTRRLLDVLLTRAGYETDAVATAAEALILLRAVDYAAIVLDLQMPGGTGFELLATLRAENPELLGRVIVVTSATLAVVAQVRDEFSVPVVRKPFEITDLVEMVETRAAQAMRPHGVTEAFCRRSVRAGATAGVLFRLRDEVLEDVASFGYPSGWLDQFLPVMLDDPYPICGTVREGQPQWFPSLASATARYPQLLPIWTYRGTCSLATVPLIRHTNILGGAGWSFREEHRFAEPEQKTFLRIAEVVADQFPS
jgi:two-component system phosphate regulon response regulator PhoB